MNLWRLVNLISYPTVIALFILEALGIVKTYYPLWIPAISAFGFGALFLWLYIPIFRDEGWNTFKAIFERKSE